MVFYLAIWAERNPERNFCKGSIGMGVHTNVDLHVARCDERESIEQTDWDLYLGPTQPRSRRLSDNQTSQGQPRTLASEEGAILK